jgi:hypothetical protein
LINSDTDISTIFKEDGLLKQLTKRIVGVLRDGEGWVIM